MMIEFFQMSENDSACCLLILGVELTFSRNYMLYDNVSLVLGWQIACGQHISDRQEVCENDSSTEWDFHRLFDTLSSYW